MMGKYANEDNEYTIKLTLFRYLKRSCSPVPKAPNGIISPIAEVAK